MKNVLYLTYDGLTDPLGQSQILPYLFGLQKSGFNIHVISFEKPENTITKNIIRKLVDQHHISWSPLRYSKRPPIISTLWDLLRLHQLVGKLHQKKNFELIHCRSYITSLIGLNYRRKRNIPFLFDMRGFWADERIDGKIWNVQNPIFRRVYNYFKKKEQEFLSEADHTISLTQKGKQVIEEELVADAAPVAVVPCCVDTDLFTIADNSRRARVRSELDILEDAFVLGFVGSIGTWYKLPEMVSFFKQLLVQKPNAIFLFITLESKALLEEAFLNAQVPSHHLRVHPGKREDMPGYISTFDWSIFFLEQKFSHIARSPVKLGEVMRMGVPVVCTSSIGDTDSIVTKYDSGVLISSLSKDAYTTAIDAMKTFNSDPQRLSDGAQDYFGLDKGVNTYINVYKEMIKDGQTEIPRLQR